MCLDCGCGKPDDSHGDVRHITMEKLLAAAQASEITTQQAAQNILDGVRQSQVLGQGVGQGMSRTAEQAG